MAVSYYVHADRPSHWLHRICLTYIILDTTQLDSCLELTHILSSQYCRIVADNRDYFLALFDQETTDSHASNIIEFLEKLKKGKRNYKKAKLI